MLEKIPIYEMPVGENEKADFKIYRVQGSVSSTKRLSTQNRITTYP